MRRLARAVQVSINVILSYDPGESGYAQQSPLLLSAVLTFIHCMESPAACASALLSPPQQTLQYLQPTAWLQLHQPAHTTYIIVH